MYHATQGMYHISFVPLQQLLSYQVTRMPENPGMPADHPLRHLCKERSAQKQAQCLRARVPHHQFHSTVCYDAVLLSRRLQLPHTHPCCSP